MKTEILKSKKFYIPAVVLIVIILASFICVIRYEREIKIAVIPITGELISSPQYNDDGSVEKGDAVAIDILAKIQKANKDKRVKAIVFVIDSTGGDITSAEEIAKAIKETTKPTVALIRTFGDSSAYWIASATGRIFALNTSATGDIGVTISYTDNVIQNKNNGLTFNQLSYGKYKDMLNPDAPLTAEEKKIIMNEINESANVFIQAVAENRHLPIEKVQALADGAPIMGQDAINDGLIDQIGSFAEMDEYLSGLLHRKVSINIPSDGIKK